MLKKESLKGALIYYDGTMNDARMNLAIIMTAIRNGAKCVNHVKVQCLLKDSRGKVCGVHVKDMLSGNEWDIKAKAVVNATGPSTDKIRKMADPDTMPICAPSTGVHVRYAIREYACTAVDVIARRMRLAFLDTKAAHEALPEVVRIMAEELGWSSDEQKKQLERARQFIDEEMGHLIPAQSATKSVR
ncbi:hypothetical protein OESDEN_09010 [Oesophagostomum dentatum]|uniref:glycerol-3-phosphate dehydrogenase n=1 Tax=Oesophagostomum dentatum TaxID=61180 RepID=A0A0B1T4V9_OESDE|nr:hypothetical protein OESDEN_09010 [Oesophagostomum dentatum]